MQRTQWSHATARDSVPLPKYQFPAHLISTFAGLTITMTLIATNSESQLIEVRQD